MAIQPQPQVKASPTVRRRKPGSFFDRFLLARIAFVAWMGFGAFLVCFQTVAFIRAGQSKSWPSTVGVLSVDVGQYRKTLSYRYSVEGVTCSSDRVIFGELGNRVQSKGWTAVSDLPNGGELAVYYQPDNPNNSTLVTGLLAGSGFNFLLGIVFLLAGGIAMIAFPTWKRLAEQTAVLNHSVTPGLKSEIPARDSEV